MPAFDEVIDEVDAARASADAQPPAQTETTADAAAAEPETQATEQTPPAEPSGAGALGREEAPGSEGTTDDDTDTETQADIKARQEKYGESWAIRSYRELMDEKRRNKSALELAPLVQAHGPALVKTGTELAAILLGSEKDAAKTFDERVKALSQQRRTELRDHYYTETVLAFPDETVQGLLGDETATVERVKRGLELLKEDEEWRAGGSQSAPADADPDDLSTLPPALRKEIEEARALRQKFPDLEREVAGFRTEQQTRRQAEQEKAVNELGDELYGKVWSVAEERKQKLGLDVKPTDTPRIAGIKRALSQHFSEESLGQAFLKDNTNRENYVRAFNHVKGLQREAAYHFEDVLKLGAERTFQGVLESQEVKDLLAALKSEMLAQSAPKDPTARDEVVAGAPAAFVPADAFAEAAKRGMTNPFDVSEEMAGAGR